MLKEKLLEDLKQSMKEKNTNRKNTNFTDVLKKYDIKLEACNLEKKYLKKAK